MFVAAVRSVGSVFLGLMVAFVLIVAVEGLSAIVHPFPVGVDPSDLEVCKAHVARYPASFLVFAIFAWSGIAFVGSWLATRLGTRRHLSHGLVVGLLLFLAVTFNLSMLPYPIWFWLNLLTIPVAFLTGARMAQPKAAPRSPDSTHEPS